MGFFDSIFGGGDPRMSTGGINDLYSQRMSQISDFSKQLEDQRNQYQSQYQNFAQQQFLTQLMPNMQAAYAGKGLQMDGGAYTAELARQAAGIQGGMLNTNFNAAQNDSMAVNSAQGQAWGSMFGAMNQANMYNAGVNNQQNQAFGQLVGNLGGAAMGAYMGGNPAASFGQNFASNLGYGGYQPNPFSSMYGGQNNKLGIGGGSPMVNGGGYSNLPAMYVRP
jgi:hypothetical protein